MPPERKPYNAFASADKWTNVNDDSGDESGEDFYDDDDDEFGLPSLANIRKKRGVDKKSAFPKAGTLSREVSSSSNYLTNSSTSQHNRSSSFDIAEERNPLSYPATKRGEGKILRPQYKDLLKDPANALHLISHPAIAAGASAKEAEAHSTRISRINKFKRILQASSVVMSDLRAAAWSGVPEEVRAMTWQLLLGYLPVNSERRVATLERKRKEYIDAARQAFGDSNGAATAKSHLVGSVANQKAAKARGRGLDEAVWHQISIDIPRTNPHIPLYGFEATQRSLERILYVWALRHPASGYVQGINDLATPFFQVFLGAYITDPNIASGMDPGQLPRPVLDAVEADSFWCLTKLLDGIQDNYIYAQPGIHRQVSALRDLTMRIDPGLAGHLEGEGVEYMQFSFRWVNCLLMRELSMKSTIRMWDTYLVSSSPPQPDVHLSENLL